jgi:hypothetical protein
MYVLNMPTYMGRALTRVLVCLTAVITSPLDCIYSCRGVAHLLFFEVSQAPGSYAAASSCITPKPCLPDVAHVAALHPVAALFLIPTHSCVVCASGNRAALPDACPQALADCDGGA